MPAGATNVGASTVTDDRRFVGSRLGSWSTDTRPAAARVGQLGYNRTTSSWEWWGGSAWTDLAPVVTWANVAGKPNAFPPDTHTHDWTAILNKPTTFPPSSHTHDWGQVTGKPTTFPPATHAHTWSSITAKPSTFPPAGHSHGSYLTSGDTISWANGSQRPYSNTATDGTFYSVWVEGSGSFCRNTSARKFKENIRDFPIDPSDVLKMRPVIYDRKGKADEETGDWMEGRKDEVGLIADEVDDLGLKWLVQYMDGEVDGLRYDLLGVALLSVVQAQEERIKRLEALVFGMGQ